MFNYNFNQYSKENSIDWQGIRESFNMDPEKSFFDTLLLTSHPQWIRDSLKYYQENLDWNPGVYWEENILTLDRKVWESASNYLQCHQEEIGLTSSATTAMGLIYGGMNLSEGDEILCSDEAHYSQLESIRFASYRSKYQIKCLKVYEDPFAADANEIIAKIADGISTKTRILALTWVHSSTGVKLPIKEISNLIKEINHKRDFERKIYLIVDGVHGFGIELSSVKDLGCDGFFTSCHKWLFGPRGTGLFWLSEELSHLISPIIPPYDAKLFGDWMRGIEHPLQRSARLLTPGGFHTFEYRWSLASAFEFHLFIGQKAIAERSMEFASKMKSALVNFSHIKLHTPLSTALSSGIICFSVEGYSPQEVVSVLKSFNMIATTTPYRRVYARLTPSLKNTEGEVLKLISLLEDFHLIARPALAKIALSALRGAGGGFYKN